MSFDSDLLKSMFGQGQVRQLVDRAKNFVDTVDGTWQSNGVVNIVKSMFS